MAHGFLIPTPPHLQTFEAAIHAALDPREAYNDIPGRDPQIR